MLQHPDRGTASAGRPVRRHTILAKPRAMPRFPCGVLAVLVGLVWMEVAIMRNFVCVACFYTQEGTFAGESADACQEVCQAF
mmetsp:Transcript_60803/g.162607  ORF Transcript_60803/g.162607 Transcript_60803/m.162607 type:complete len:82 (-) Transcript_60803:36-281(-)